MQSIVVQHSGHSELEKHACAEVRGSGPVAHHAAPGRIVFGPDTDVQSWYVLPIHLNGNEHIDVEFVQRRSHRNAVGIPNSLRPTTQQNVFRSDAAYQVRQERRHRNWFV